MKRAVRNENHMGSPKEHAQWRDELAVERFQVALRGAQQLLFMRLSAFLKVFQLLARLGFGLQLLELNAVVIPIEFFSQIADSPDQLALTRLSERKALAALKNHFDHVARLRRFDAGESLLVRSPGVPATQVKGDQRLINLHSIFDKGDLKLLALQPAAQRFERAARLQISAVRRLPLAARASAFSFEEMRLVHQHRRLKPGKLGNGCAGFLVGPSKIIHLESDLSEKKMRQYGFSRKR